MLALQFEPCNNLPVHLLCSNNLPVHLLCKPSTLQHPLRHWEHILLKRMFCSCSCSDFACMSDSHFDLEYAMVLHISRFCACSGFPAELLLRVFQFRAAALLVLWFSPRATRGIALSPGLATVPVLRVSRICACPELVSQKDSTSNRFFSQHSDYLPLHATHPVQ